MFPLYFPASLKTADNKLLEMGEAYVSDTEDAVYFTNDFVPLMKMGTEVCIVRTLGDREQERFVGHVYLSSRNLLQIVDVDNYIISEVRRLFTVNENLGVELYASSKPSHFGNLQKLTYFPGTIRYVSRDLFKICTMEYVAEGDYLAFSTDGPGILLNQLVVRVTERVLLRRSVAILLCEVWHPNAENRAALAAYSSARKSTGF